MVFNTKGGKKPQVNKTILNSYRAIDALCDELCVKIPIVKLQVAPPEFYTSDILTVSSAMVSQTASPSECSAALSSAANFFSAMWIPASSMARIVDSLPAGTTHSGSQITVANARVRDSDDSGKCKYKLFSTTL